MEALSRPDLFRLVVPTRNSGRWLGYFIAGYRSVGLNPLFLLDRRSNDDSKEILSREGADVAEVSPVADRAEALIGLIPGLCGGSRWVLRLDDDEFPSAAMLRWIAANLLEVSADVILLPRRWCLSSDEGIPCYSAA